MKTFSVAVLGCRVNHYVAEQIAGLLSGRGLTRVPAPGGDVRVVHTCWVTGEAAGKSRQTTRRATRLPVLDKRPTPDAGDASAKVIVTGCWAASDAHCTYCTIPQLRPTLWSKSVGDAAEPGDLLRARVDRAVGDRATGTVVS